MQLRQLPGVRAAGAAWTTAGRDKQRFEAELVLDPEFLLLLYLIMASRNPSGQPLLYTAKPALAVIQTYN